MKVTIKIAFIAFVALMSACSKDASDPIDTTYPEIIMTGADAFPKQCSTIKRGEKFNFVALLQDNAQLGSASIDIHHNFDHHSHSTEVSDCTAEPKKAAVKPFVLIKTLEIPAGIKSHQISSEIIVPADIDAGDYHFLIRLTDKEGWQTIKGISIKII